MIIETLTASEAERTNMTIHGKVHQHHGTLCTHSQPGNRNLYTVKMSAIPEL